MSRIKDRIDAWGSEDAGEVLNMYFAFVFTKGKDMEDSEISVG